MEELDSLRAEAFSSRVEREIIAILYDFRGVNPLRPKTILENMPPELSFSSGSGLQYHLDKLCRAGLVQRKQVGRKLTWYSLTPEGVEFYERFPRKGTVEDTIRFLVSIIAPFAKGVSDAEIRRTLTLLLNREEAQVERG